MCVQHPHVFRRRNNNFKLWGTSGVMGIQQLLGFIGALWNHKNATDEAFKMKVMPLETAMFFGNLHTNEVSFKRRATGSCCKDPSIWSMWINVYTGWCCLGVSGWEWEEVTKNFNHSGSLRIMSRVCEGMCGRESFLRFFAASTIAAWQRPEYWQRSAAVRGKHKCAEMPNTNVQKCRTQMCRNAKHKFAEMPNTSMKECKTSLVCRNELCWWVISREFCFYQ